MQVVVVILAFVFGLLLVIAAFVYVFDPAAAGRILGQIRVPVYMSLALFIAVTVVGNIVRLSLLVGLAAMGVAAFLIRESRKPKREKKPSFGGAERTPIVPRTEPGDGVAEDSEKDEDQ